MTVSPALLLLPALALLAGALFPELRQAPENPPSPPKPLTPLLKRDNGEAVTTREGWKRRREELKRAWSEILGPFPRRVPLHVRVVAEEDFPDHRRLLLRYQSDPAAENEAYLLVPKPDSGKHPGMVVLHQTTDRTIEQPVGISGREQMYLALHLVRRGYVCIVPRNFLWTRPDLKLPETTTAVLKEGHWHTGLAKMTWDAIRATDVLAEWPGVDPKRIGTIGHSLGGKEVLWHAAFDDRIRAAVSCEGGIGLSFSNWDAEWYLGGQIHDPAFRRDQHEVLALAAPRPFLLIGGQSADGAQSWPYIEAALPVWRLFGAEERLGLLRHHFGHDFPPPGPEREQVYAWLDHWIKS